MKISAVILVVCFLCGCRAGDNQLDQAMDLRKKLLEAQTCSFTAVVTADYGDALYTFQMDCTADSAGILEFTVTDPETIAGITGNISQESAALTFDDKVLAFPMMADGELTPVCAPWIFLNTLRSGYLTGCKSEDNGLSIYIDDTFENKPLRLLISTGENAVPVYAEIIWQDYRILSLDIRDFAIQ